MFDFFNRKPKCPLTSEDQSWVETRLNLLRRELGGKRLQQARTIEPTPDFFPGQYDGSDASVERLFLQVCRYMELPEHKVELKLYDFGQAGGLSLDGPFAAGLFHGGYPYQVSINTHLRKSQTAMVAVMAHELSHVILLGECRMDPSRQDNEELTDLATVTLGMGIFTINSKIRVTRGGGLSSMGYLPLTHLCYAIALLEFRRTMKLPPWLDHLESSGRSLFKRSWKYLEQATPQAPCQFTWNGE